MGHYIEVPVHHNKANYMRSFYGALDTNPPPSLSSIPEDTVLLCVVVNPMFDAVAIIYNDFELEAFSDPSDTRRKDWLLISKEDAINLNPYAFVNA